MVCPICGAQVDNNSTECFLCGYRFPADENQQETFNDDISELINNNDELCNTCGAVLSDNDEVCPICGAQIERQTVITEEPKVEDTKTVSEPENEDEQKQGNQKTPLKVPLIIIISLCVLLCCVICIMGYYMSAKNDNKTVPKADNSSVVTNGIESSESKTSKTKVTTTTTTRPKTKKTTTTTKATKIKQMYIPVDTYYGSDEGDMYEYSGLGTFLYYGPDEHKYDITSTRIDRGTVIQECGRTDNGAWLYVSIYNQDKFGWIKNASLVEIVEEPKHNVGNGYNVVIKSDADFRYGPNEIRDTIPDYPIIRTNELVTVYGFSDDNWLYVEYNGMYGWIDGNKAEYLENNNIYDDYETDYDYTLGYVSIEDELGGNSYLRQLSDYEIQLLINGILARNGYSFKDDEWYNLFSRFSWYNPDTTNMKTVESRFNSVERANYYFLANYRDTH